MLTYLTMTMSKKTSNQPKAEKQPAYVDELLKKGTVVLQAKSREALAEMVDCIPASCRYGAGAIGKNNESGIYSLRLDIINE